jgi:hypothetical protein
MGATGAAGFEGAGVSRGGSGCGGAGSTSRGGANFRSKRGSIFITGLFGSGAEGAFSILFMSEGK